METEKNHKLKNQSTKGQYSCDKTYPSSIKDPQLDQSQDFEMMKLNSFFIKQIQRQTVCSYSKKNEPDQYQALDRRKIDVILSLVGRQIRNLSKRVYFSIWGLFQYVFIYLFFWWDIYVNVVPAEAVGVVKNFAIFKGKYLCWRLFLIKLQA